MSSKDMKQLKRRLEKQGFDVHIARSGHYRVTRPGHQGAVTMPTTPRKGRSSEKNVRANLRRYLGADL